MNDSVKKAERKEALRFVGKWALIIAAWFTLVFIEANFYPSKFHFSLWLGAVLLFGYHYIKEKDSGPKEESARHIYNKIAFIESYEEKVKYVQKLKDQRVLGAEEVLKTLRLKMVKDPTSN